MANLEPHKVIDKLFEDYQNGYTTPLDFIEHITLHNAKEGGGLYEINRCEGVNQVVYMYGKHVVFIKLVQTQIKDI